MGRNGLIILGVVIALLGLAGIAVPSFTTRETNEVAHIGDLKIQATENKQHFVPPLLSGGAILLGVVLIGAGVTRRS